MPRFIEINEENFRILLNAFYNGADNLSASNPINEGRDKRPGANGGEVLLAEKNLLKKLMSITKEREFTADELQDYCEEFSKSKKREPSLKEIEKLDKPYELINSTALLELTDSEYERLLLYVQNARWSTRFAIKAATVLEMVQNAQTVKPISEEK